MTIENSITKFYLNKNEMMPLVDQHLVFDLIQIYIEMSMKFKLYERNVSMLLKGVI